MSDHRGMILLDALLGLLMISVIAVLIYSASSLKNSVEFDSACSEMEDIWRNEEYLEIYDPSHHILPEPVLEEIPLLDDGQGLPLLN